MGPPGAPFRLGPGQNAPVTPPVGGPGFDLPPNYAQFRNHVITKYVPFMSWAIDDDKQHVVRQNSRFATRPGTHKIV